MAEAAEKERQAAAELFKAKQQEKNTKEADATKDKDEKALVMEMERRLEFINDIVTRNKLQGVELNMMDGLAKDMMDMARSGKSPVCAVEKRLANGKLMAYNLARQFDLIAPDTDINAFMNDSNDWWTSQYTTMTTAAQTES